VGGNYLEPFAKQQQGSGLRLDLSHEPPPKRSRLSKVGAQYCTVCPTHWASVSD